MSNASARSRGPILVVDDDECFRELVVAVLEHVGYPTREASTGEEALDTARREPPRLVVLDVRLPGIPGYEVCRRLRDEFGNDLPIVFVSGERTESYDRVAGFLVGGDDYLVKPFALDEFVARVRRHVERVQRRFPSSFALTPREVEVLYLLADGLGTSEIARRVFITPKTATTHIEHIFKKLGVHTRTQAVSLAYRHGLLERLHERMSVLSDD
jgi:two-component system, OmpR family, response regulator CssR